MKDITSYETFNDLHPLEIPGVDSDCQIHKNRIWALRNPTSFYKWQFGMAAESDGWHIKGRNLNMTSLTRRENERQTNRIQNGGKLFHYFTVDFLCELYEFKGNQVFKEQLEFFFKKYLIS